MVGDVTWCPGLNDCILGHVGDFEYYYEKKFNKKLVKCSISLSVLITINSSTTVDSISKSFMDYEKV